MEQLSRSLKRELSFQRELSNLQVFQRLLANEPGVRIPKSFPRYSTSLVLTMERLSGDSIHELMDSENDLRFDRVAFARRISNLYVESIFIHGLYHADPHPGNIIVQSDGAIGLLDFGMVGRIDDSLRGSIEEMLFAVASQDSALLTSLIKRAGKIPATIDDAQLSNDVADLIATYATQQLESMDLASVLNDATDVLHRHRITLPSQMSILIKT
ncbi:MAG: AarF/UbiB family protein, partial [bacterium]